MLSNRNYSTETAQRIPFQIISLMQPKEGASYMHHSHIAFYKGKFYVTFSLGEVNEDDCRQKVMLCTSEDGEHFTEPTVIFSGAEIGDPERITSSGGIFVDEETGLLVFTFGSMALDPS